MVDQPREPPGGPEPVGAGSYNVYTGVHTGGSTGVEAGADAGASCGGDIPAAARLGLEPPRFCSRCGRRLVVQVRPDGWWAACSRHGRVDSTELETER